MKGLLTRLRIFINCAENDIIEQPCAYSPIALQVIKSTQAAAEFCLLWISSLLCGYTCHSSAQVSSSEGQSWAGSRDTHCTLPPQTHLGISLEKKVDKEGEKNDKVINCRDPESLQARTRQREEQLLSFSCLLLPMVWKVFLNIMYENVGPHFVHEATLCLAVSWCLGLTLASLLCVLELNCCNITIQKLKKYLFSVFGCSHFLLLTVH